jgi:hypothetical protein
MKMAFLKRDRVGWLARSASSGERSATRRDPAGRPARVPWSIAWAPEGYAGDNGWAVGAGEEYTDLIYRAHTHSGVADRHPQVRLAGSVAPATRNFTEVSLPWIAGPSSSPSCID